jgi:hypothetical protein
MIDTTTLTNKITALRQLAEKNAISPETLGAILQRIADLLATASTQSEVDVLTNWNKALKQVPAAITAIARGTYDRNNFLVNLTKLTLSNGAITTQTDYTLIPQATTDHAGMMRAQQVTDLNTVRNKVDSKILPTLELIGEQIEDLQTTIEKTQIISRHITCEVMGDYIYIQGAAKLIAEGYVPYLFRSSSRKIHDHQHQTSGPYKKGWHLFGSKHTIKIDDEGIVNFSTNDKGYIDLEAEDYSPEIQTILHLKTDKDGHKYVPWGTSQISVYDKKADKNRMLRLHYAIGFAKEKPVSRNTINGADLVTNLATFSIVYNPKYDEWHASR